MNSLWLVVGNTAGKPNAGHVLLCMQRKRLPILIGGRWLVTTGLMARELLKEKDRRKNIGWQGRSRSIRFAASAEMFLTRKILAPAKALSMACERTAKNATANRMQKAGLEI